MDNDKLQEIKERIRSTPRNKQSDIGRRYCIRRLKTNGVKPCKHYWKLKNTQISQLYKKKFGEHKDFSSLNIKKKDATSFMYYEYLKSKTKVHECGGVYVIGNIEKGICKIGYSTNPHERLKSIQTGCPYELSVLKYYEGIGTREEKMLHKKYKKYRLQGEWFEIKGGIRHELL